MILAVKTDITKVTDVDAIVNAANISLLGGTGVDGAIHAAAGPELLQECKKLHGCETGKAKITKAYQLPCTFIIHTVGPIWQGGKAGEPELLRNCYRNSLKLAVNNNIRSLAFPAISTGAYHYPVKEAARIAVETVKEFVKDNPDAFERIEFVLYEDSTKEIYDALLKE